MNLKLVLVFCIAIVKNSFQSECGKRLEHGAVMCILSKTNMLVDPFEFNLCTHGVIMIDYSCANETCGFSWSEESISLSKWARPHFPQKLGLLLNPKNGLYEYLSTPERRSNAAKNMTDWMQNNGMTFVRVPLLNSASNTTTSHFNDFVEELAINFHKHDFYVGLDFIPWEDELFISYNWKMLSQVVDWFIFSALKKASFNGYMQPLSPLTSFNGSAAGSTKYWIEKSLRLVKPECLVFDVGPAMQIQTAIESTVDPGPGSKAILTTKPFSYWISELCYQLLVENTCREFWDEGSSTPWVVCGNDYYTYDNARSLQLKVDLAKQYNITRLEFWTIDINPDNICGDGDPLILLKAVQGIRQMTTKKIN